jgi:tetratricopeptide (TPR) repeat protein
MKRMLLCLFLVTILACPFAGAGPQNKTHARAKNAPAKASPAEEAPTPNPYTSAIRANNLGIALMEHGEFEMALGDFQQACILDPMSDAGCVNMGIALLNLHRYEQARTIFAKALEHDSQSAWVWFNLGLVDRIAGKTDAALSDFEKVRAIDPRDPTTAYFIGLVNSEAARDEKAVPNFEAASNMDPLNSSVELELAQALARVGNIDDSIKHLQKLQRLISTNLSHTVASTYGNQGKYSLAEEIAVEPVVPAVSLIHFIDVTPTSGLPKHFADEASQESGRKRSKTGEGGQDQPISKFLGSGACVFDLDGDGKLDIFLVDGDGKGNSALYRNAGHGQFVNATKAAGLKFHGDGTGCATGDYNNDGNMDLAVSSAEGVRLFENQGKGKFKDVTEEAGIQIDGLAMGLTFFDYDRDGYLDLYVTRINNFGVTSYAQPFSIPTDPAPPGNMLWHNAGHGTFVDATSDVGARSNAASIAALPTDTRNVGATDLLVTGLNDHPVLLADKGDGTFENTNPWLGETPNMTAGAVALDFDKDGWTDYAFTQWSGAGISLWRNDEGLAFEKALLPDPGWMRGWGLSALDYDNDGWVDLVALGETFASEGRILLLRNEGAKGFRDVTQETGLDRVKLHNPRGVIAADFDGDGAVDLLITQNHAAPLLLKANGGNEHGWIELALKGLGNSSPDGATVVVLSGDQRQKWEVRGASGYLGSGPADIHAGLGEVGGADVVRVRWPREKQQNEMQIRGETKVVISQLEASKSTASPAAPSR